MGGVDFTRPGQRSSPSPTLFYDRRTAVTMPVAIGKIPHRWSTVTLSAARRLARFVVDLRFEDLPTPVVDQAGRLALASSWACSRRGWCYPPSPLSRRTLAWRP